MKQLSKKEFRRFKYLVDAYPVTNWNLFGVEDFERYFETNRGYMKTISKKNTSGDFWRRIGEIEELWKLYKRSGLTIEEFYEMVKEVNFEKVSRRAIYKKKPTRIRKDNKDTINYGSGGYNRNVIRYPKKCRKTAWKRFYKLFPHLKDKK